MRSITIVQDSRDWSFHLVDDTDGRLIEGTYSTLAEARQAVADLAHRIPPGYVDRLLLAENEEQKTLGRLLASEAWPEFERWLDSERIQTPDEATRVLKAVVSYAALMIAGVAREHWPVGKAEVDRSIERLVLRQLKTLMEAD